MSYSIKEKSILRSTIITLKNKYVGRITLDYKKENGLLVMVIDDHSYCRRAGR